MKLDKEGYPRFLRGTFPWSLFRMAYNNSS